MKRIKFIIIPLVLMAALVFSACGKQASDKGSLKETVAQTQAAAAEAPEGTTQAETQAQTQASLPDNEKPVCLYHMDYAESLAVLADEFSAYWDDEQDIGVFGAFNCYDDEIYFDSEGETHKELWEAEETEADYRIGYVISFTAGGRDYSVTITEPGDIEDSELLFGGDVDTEEVTGYVGVWVYDDIAHIGDGFYSHVTQDEFYDDTLLTSIKLRFTPAYDEMETLYLTGFTYSSEAEFDAQGNYIGEYGYTVEIIAR